MGPTVGEIMTDPKSVLFRISPNWRNVTQGCHCFPSVEQAAFICRVILRGCSSVDLFHLRTPDALVDLCAENSHPSDTMLGLSLTDVSLMDEIKDNYTIAGVGQWH